MRAVSYMASAVFFFMQFVPAAPQPGTVAGRIDIKPGPARQEVSRYPTTGGTVQKSVAPISTVVYVEGPVTGAQAWPAIPKPMMVQKEFQFSPVLLVIPKDTVVSFPNEDGEFHNVFSYSKAKRFDLGRYPKGESKSVAFDTSGIVKIYCEVHPWMRGAVVVLENPFYAIVARDGSFSIKGIPAGHYDLVIWNVDAGSKRVGVDVSAGLTQQLDLQLSGVFEAGNTMPLSVAIGTGHEPGALPKGNCCAGRR